MCRLFDRLTRLTESRMFVPCIYLEVKKDAVIYATPVVNIEEGDAQKKEHISRPYTNASEARTSRKSGVAFQQLICDARTSLLLLLFHLLHFLRDRLLRCFL